MVAGRAFCGVIMMLMSFGGCATPPGQDAGNGASALPSNSVPPIGQVGTGTPGLTKPTASDPQCADIYQGAVVGTLTGADSLTQVQVCVVNTVSQNADIKTLTGVDSQETLDWLAGLMAQPSASRDADLICTAELRKVKDFVVTTESGQVLAPTVPTDPCGKPSLDVVQLLDQIGAG